MPPLRVLHLAKYWPPHPGGMETFVADLARAQARQGLAVAALVHQEMRQETGPGTAASATDEPDVDLCPVPSHGQLLYAPLAPGWPLALHRAIRRHRPQLLHIHLPNTSAFLALALPAARRLPWLIHWHADVVSTGVDRRLAPAHVAYRLPEGRMLRRARRIIATSPEYLAASPTLAGHRDRAVVVPLGLDRRRLPPADGPTARDAWPGSGLRLLSVGRLTPYKGHGILLEALCHLPGASLVIAGDGPLRQHLEQRVHALKLHGRVHLAGRVDDRRLAALYRAAEVFCLPSLERTEAFGLVLLEAMHFRCPIVASHIAGSGVPWVLEHGGAGLLTAPGDAGALAATLRRLQDEPALRQQLVAAGEQRLAGLGIDPVADATIRVYEDTVLQQ